MYVATAICIKSLNFCNLKGLQNPAQNFHMAFLTPLYTTFPAQNCPNLCYIYSNIVLLAWYICTQISMKLSSSLEKKDNLNKAFSAVLPRFSNHKLGVFYTYCWLVSMTTKLILLGLLLLVSTIPRGSVTCHFSSQSNCWWQFVLSVWFYLHFWTSCEC